MGQGKSQIAIKKGVCLFYFLLPFALQVRRSWKEAQQGFDYLILQKIAPKLLKLSLAYHFLLHIFKDHIFDSFWFCQETGKKSPKKFHERFDQLFVFLFSKIFKLLLKILSKHCVEKVSIQIFRQVKTDLKRMFLYK